MQLIEEKTGRAVRGLLLHDQGPRHVRRLLRRSARALDRAAQGIQAAEHVERLLEGRRAEPADAAHLRHGVLQRDGAEGAPQRIEEAKKRDHRKVGKELGCSCSTRGRRARRSGSPRARCSGTRSPTTCAACSSRPATSKSRRRSSSTRRCGRRPDTGSTTARTCSSSRAKRSRWG